MGHWLDSWTAPLEVVLFHFGQDAVTWSELLGFVTGAACVWLTVRFHIANFPIGIANNVFFLVLFWTARLYADASLQIVYLALGFLGWWEWLHGGERRGRRMMGRASGRLVGTLLLLVVPATWGLTAILSAAHDIAPFWDALTTALSLAAQWLLNLKKLQNWYLWIAADVIYVPLYFVKVLYLTGIVYVLFLGLCVLGLRAWVKEIGPRDADPGAAGLGNVAAA
ncbi:nicotinamide mononucleotide transporter [Actinospica durhamensis]|uniref:Nicotinamide mononucleotide transporter n=1 Tax=Actinospica durhamensis TaxID=1508375 RepID=A0A941EXW5_9ACTN|nr:nicotinamide riboside transporter PnuC [Actinospica durhamensis]MBR7838357.1 nicotinamide mononucleotide transporter [Actinospica durhamensis]